MSRDYCAEKCDVYGEHRPLCPNRRPQESTAIELLREWIKKAEKFPELDEFRGGYKPFLTRETKRFLAAIDGRNK